MSDDEFDLPDAEEYFAAHAPKPKPAAAVIPPELLDEFDDDDLDEVSAMQACLALPEMLERIILFAPPLEVYRLQLVNTFWRDLITRSIPIRRHMYFVPDKYFVRSELNMLLDTKRAPVSRKLQDALYPFICQLFAHKDKVGVTVEVRDAWVHSMRHRPPQNLFPEREAPREHSDSWRRILISDSSVPLDINVELAPAHGPWPVPCSIQLTGQVTLGDVISESKRLTQEAFKHQEEARAFDARGIIDWDTESFNGSFDDSDDDFEIHSVMAGEASLQRIRRILGIR